jgi:exodeoxyribonuclease VII small subunit
LWERGEQLADVCQRWLDQASTRLDDAITAREGDQSTS